MLLHQGTKENRIRRGARIIISALLMAGLLGFCPAAEAASSQTDDASSDYGDYSYLVEPYGGFGPGARVTHDEDGEPQSVNGYPVRPVRASFSNLGTLHHFDHYFMEYPFWRNAAQYDGNLACMSLMMSLSANRNDPSDSAAELEQFLRDAGFTDIQKDDYSGETSMHTIGTAIGQQTMQHDGEEPFTLLAIGVCGANYSNEWQSNINIGTGDTHAGFASASKLVTSRLNDYIQTHGIQGRVKVWISGHSRAAAVANLTAGTLVDTGAFPKEDVFAYTFAAPTVAKDLPKKGFENIHNIQDPMDTVPQFPPAGWGYGRYGQDYYIRVREFVSEYGGLSTGVRDEMNEVSWNVENNYSPELNLRMRLMLSMLFETIGNSENYTKTIYPALLGIMQDGSTTNIMRTLRALMVQERRADSETREMVDGLVDYTLRTVAFLALRKGYSGADSNTGSLAMRLLAEHTQNTYLANVASIRGGLFADSEVFYYVMVRGPVSVRITWKDGDLESPILDITRDGEKRRPKEAKKILGDGMSQMLADSLYTERTGGTTVVAIPTDRDLYRVDWAAESSGTVSCLQVQCDTDVSILYKGALSGPMKVKMGDAGTAFQNREDGTILPTTFYDVTMRGLQIAKFMEIADLGMSWRAGITWICALAGLLLCALLCLVVSLLRRRRPAVGIWALIGLMGISILESITAYWLMADMPSVWIIWLCAACVALILLLLLRRSAARRIRQRDDRVV